jgi:hypothetical protein
MLNDTGFSGASGCFGAVSASRYPDPAPGFAGVGLALPRDKDADDIGVFERPCRVLGEPGRAGFSCSLTGEDDLVC